MDGERWWRTLVETAAVVPCLAAFLWACYAALNTLLVVTADDFPQCSIDPDKVALTLVTLVVIALAAASLVLVIRRRTLVAYACVLAQVPLVAAWTELGADAASCLIG